MKDISRMFQIQSRTQMGYQENSSLEFINYNMRVRGGEKQDKKGTPFIRKLIEVLNDEKSNFIINWGDSRNQFVIHSVTEFSNNVLPILFKHSNYSSFVRQLNMYGFTKVKGKEHAYEHEHLDCKNPQNFYLINRQNKKKIQQETAKRQKAESSRYYENLQSGVKELSKKIKERKKQNKLVKKQIEILAKQINSVKENFNKLMCQNLLEAFHHTRGINNRHIVFLQEILKSQDIGGWKQKVEGKEKIQTLQILRFILKQKIHNVAKVKIVIELILEGKQNIADDLQLQQYSPSEISLNQMDYAFEEDGYSHIDQFMN